MPIHNVLIVDDSGSVEPAFGEIVSEEAILCMVRVATTCEEAIDSLNSDSYTLILTESNMTGFNGIEFIKYLNNNARGDAKIIVVSSVAKPQMVKDAIINGADYYVRKPFTTNFLKEKILDWLKDEPTEDSAK